MNGIVLINKEKGISSFGVVSKVRKIFDTKKVGHCGTLDPEATGVLPIMIGNATKASKYLVEHDKEYVSIVKLGIKTDTADCEGKIIGEDEFRLKESDIDFYKEKINELIGKSKQRPPMYSAIKVNGKKLYEYARSGESIEIPEREIEIYELEILNFDFENNEIKFRAKCSKGTYIRTLCEMIAEKISTIGYMKELTRTKLDKFDISQSVCLNELENSSEKEKYVISLEKVFEEKGDINLSEKKLELFLNGVKLDYDLEDNIYKIYANKIFKGIGKIENKKLKRDIII